MSAHFKVSEIGFFSLDQWPVTVCAWRGCCIEIFARAEHSVADCLRALEAARIALPKDAHSPAAGTRIRVLRNCIASHSFGNHGKVALDRIAQWENIHETRAQLAHGRIRATANGIVIQHIAFDGKAENRIPARQLSRFEMLAALAEMEQAQMKLHQQLGHIKALAAQAKPLPPA